MPRFSKMTAIRKETVEPPTYYLLTRLQQELSEGRTTFGGIATATLRDVEENDPMRLPERALTAGIDFRQLWLDRTHYFEFALMGSRLDGSRCHSAPAGEFLHNYWRPDARHVVYDPTAGGVDRVGR
jgi:hypothetical protein